MAQKTRAAVIGAGLIAKQHLGALTRLEDVDVVGVCDLSPISAEVAADRFGLEHWYDNHAEMLSKQSPGVVHITTPAPTHFSLAMHCLDAGCHVVVEKPLASDLSECEQLVEEAANRDRWLIEDYNYQFNDSVQEMLGYVASGELGDVRQVEVQLCLGLFGEGSRFADRDAPHPAMTTRIGAVSDFLTHLCYLAHAFIGPHRRVTPVGKRLHVAESAGFDFFQCLIEGESATGLIGMTSDAEIDGLFVRVQGTKMRAETNLFETGVVTTRAMSGPKPLAPIRNSLARSRSERRSARRSLSRKLSGGPGAYEGLWSLVERSYKRLREGGAPPLTLQKILEVNRLCADIINEAIDA